MAEPIPIWQRDEAACRRYESCSVKYLLAPWATELLQRVQPCSGVQLLDVACGTGLIARTAAPALGTRGRIIGVDSSEHMLRVARSLPAPAGAPIEWRHADAAALPLGDAMCDVVLCHQGLQFFADRAAALREVRRVISPRGKLAFAMWNVIDAQPYYAAVAEAAERYVGSEAAQLVRSACALCDPQQIGALFSGAGFEAPAVERLRKEVHLPPAGEFAAEHLRGTSLAGAVEALEPARRQAFFRQIVQRMEPYRESAGIAVPFEIQLVSWRGAAGRSA